MSERGVIIVGTGLITKFHAQAVNASSKLTLKGFVGRTKEKAAARAAEFGGEAFDDLDAAFSAPGVGLAVVATASGAHDEAVFAAYGLRPGASAAEIVLELKMRYDENVANAKPDRIDRDRPRQSGLHRGR